MIPNMRRNILGFNRHRRALGRYRHYSADDSGMLLLVIALICLFISVYREYCQ